MFTSSSTTSPSHIVDQAVDCGLWNFVPLFFNSCAKLLDIGGNWNTLSYLLSIPQSIPKHAKWVTCLVSMQAMEENRILFVTGAKYNTLP
jgi:hypothetical protein